MDFGPKNIFRFVHGGYDARNEHTIHTMHLRILELGEYAKLWYNFIDELLLYWGLSFSFSLLLHLLVLVMINAVEFKLYHSWWKWPLCFRFLPTLEKPELKSASNKSDFRFRLIGWWNKSQPNYMISLKPVKLIENGLCVYACVYVCMSRALVQ